MLEDGGDRRGEDRLTARAATRPRSRSGRGRLQVTAHEGERSNRPAAPAARWLRPGSALHAGERDVAAEVRWSGGRPRPAVAATTAAATSSRPLTGAPRTPRPSRCVRGDGSASVDRRGRPRAPRHRVHLRVAQEAERDMPLRAARPPDLRQRGSGQALEHVEHVVGRPHRDEEALAQACTPRSASRSSRRRRSRFERRDHGELAHLVAVAGQAELRRLRHAVDGAARRTTCRPAGRPARSGRPRR